MITERNGLIFICGDAAGMGKGKGLSPKMSIYYVLINKPFKGIQKVLMDSFGNEQYFELLRSKLIREDLWR